jgi:hypothetical protein
MSNLMKRSASGVFEGYAIKYLTKLDKVDVAAALNIIMTKTIYLLRQTQKLNRRSLTWNIKELVLG